MNILSIARLAAAPYPEARTPVPRAGTIDDIESEDDRRGLEPDDDFYSLIQRLVADGDRRAASLGRSAPRTAAEMRARLNKGTTR
ncbi:hypothetical protein [Streptomyces jumonjinensis]|uniref:Uncharacterized protein n=1 Tax=Streptomyces jumonjinensis TaxID=1945 RepID=A0A646KL85_STRJU|nr:hypothetical protein [Streptomyces jumonjinensis]MQT02818.1 hypothetical protein [Streptomyces jumonjinensis]